MNVLQLIDSLDAGGAERMAVNLANGLVRKVNTSHLCVSRKEGILKRTISDTVGYIFLNKKRTIDIKALRKLRQYIKQNKIDIIHAHSSSFFLAILLKLSLPKIKIVWHDHYGKSEQLNTRPKKVLVWCSKWFSQIFSVNEKLRQWALKELKCKQVQFLPNFAALNTEMIPTTFLKGETHCRILCLANLRPQKDFENLLEAFEIVHNKHPHWTLHCVGKDFEDAYAAKIYNYVQTRQLKPAVFFYGSCSDIPHIMGQCDIGVLASKSEGLPLALLEYGLGMLPVVATDVGDCQLVIATDDLGILVAPNDVKVLAQGICELIDDKEERLRLGSQLHQNVKEKYSSTSVIKKILKTYFSILNA